LPVSPSARCGIFSVTTTEGVCRGDKKWPH
jgi:hypothetical protein